MGHASGGAGPSTNGAGRPGTLDGGDKLPRGGGKLPREQVLARQRTRIMEATVRVVAEDGMRGASVTQVTSAAGVSRVTFYEQFANFEECFLAVLDATMRHSTALIAEAFERSDTWQERAVGALAALLSSLDCDPPLARVCLVEALAAGPAALEYRARELERIKHMVDVAAGEGGGERHASMLGAEAIVASVAGILHGGVVRNELPPFMGLLTPLAEVVLGREITAAAGFAQLLERAQLWARAAVAERRGPAAAGVAIPNGLSNPAAHQTRRCLRYVVGHPGASNGAVGEGIGIKYRAQTTALLARLADLDLVTKHSGGPGRANAWTATPHGEQVARALEEGSWM